MRAMRAAHRFAPPAIQDGQVGSNGSLCQRAPLLANVSLQGPLLHYVSLRRLAPVATLPLQSLRLRSWPS